MENAKTKNVAVIVAHPDDETLWTGGTLLNHPSWKCFIVCMSRVNDPDRAPKFYKALETYKSKGIMGNLDDSPEQKPLDELEIENAILNLLPQNFFDLIITHNPSGEYTKHLRHEEISRAVIKLWHSGKIFTNELRTFAYEDVTEKNHPMPVKEAPVYRFLTKRIWLRKYSIITEIYGFEKNSFEAETTPRAEAFWQFTDPFDAKKWLSNGGVL